MSSTILRFSALSLVLCSLTSFGQITITKDQMPKAGSSIEYSNASQTTSVDVDKTGANTSWDFSGLSANSNGTIEYESSLKTPYILSFGFSAIGKKLSDTLGFSSFQMKNIYNFYKTSSSSYSDVGIGFQFSALPIPQTGKHSDPDEVYFFPLQYGNRDSSTFEVTVPISAGIAKVGSFTRKGYRITTVDGWGKITTPYLTNEDCIRVKSVLVEHDSISVTVPSFNFGTDVIQVEYKWLSKSEQIPVLLISGTEVAGQFVPSLIQYRDEWSASSPIVVGFEADKQVVETGEVVSFTNTTTGDNLTFQWDITPTTGFIFVNGTGASSANPKVVFQANGNYSVKLTATNGSNTENLTKTDYIEVKDNNSSVGTVKNSIYTIHPNPVQNTINLTFLSKNTLHHVQLLDVSGKVVWEGNAENDVHIDVRFVEHGTYFLQIDNTETRSFERILIY